MSIEALHKFSLSLYLFPSTLLPTSSLFRRSFSLPLKIQNVIRFTACFKCEQTKRHDDSQQFNTRDFSIKNLMFAFECCIVSSRLERSSTFSMGTFKVFQVNSREFSPSKHTVSTSNISLILLSINSTAPAKNV